MVGIYDPDQEDAQNVAQEPNQEISNIQTVGGSGAADTSGTAGTSSSAPAGADRSLGNQNSVSKIVGLNANAPYNQILDPIGQQGEASNKAVDDAYQSFLTGAGSNFDFGDDDRGSIDTGLTGQGPLSATRDLINTSYKGPQNVDEGLYKTGLRNFGDSAQQVTSPDSLGTYLGKLFPQDTPGMLAFDNLVYGQNPNFKSDAGGYLKNFYDTAGRAATNFDTSTGIADERETSAKEFANKAKGYVTDRQTNTLSAIEQQRAAQNKQNADAEALYQALLTGASPLSAAGINAQGRQFVSDPDSLTPFSGSIDPKSYLTFAPGMGATLNTAANADQSTVYNNAEDLLGLTGRYVNPMDWQGPSIGFNQGAFDARMAELAGLLAAANANRRPAPVAQPVFNPATQTWVDPGGGVAGQDSMGDAAAAAAAEGNAGAAAADASSESGDGSGGAGAAGNAGTGGNGDAGSNGPGAGGGGESGDFAEGGFIEGPGGPREDKIKANLSDGEFVLNADSTAVVGPQNMERINSIGNKRPINKLAMAMALEDTANKMKQQFSWGGMVKKRAAC